MAATVKPVNPNARNIRAALRAAGLEHHVEGITSGSKRSRVRLHGFDEDVAAQVARAIAPLWDDNRVRVVYGGLVIVERDRWFRTFPATPEGQAARQAEEDERTASLLALPDDRKFSTRDYSRVTYQPSGTDPRKPWIDRVGVRFSSLDVFPL